MLWATPQRTADNRLEAPTPKMLPEMTCVVLTGIPRCPAPKMTILAETSAAKPCTGSRRMMRCPIVLMMRQPPAEVPNAIAVAQAMMTQSGMAGLLGLAACTRPWLTSAMVMMPMLFCASLEPWLKAMAAEERICSLRNQEIGRAHV